MHPSSPTCLAPTFQIYILGLGNLMRTDDALGMLTTRLLETDPRLPGDITVIEGGTLGLDLLGRIDDATHLLVLDAVDVGAAPGTLVRFAGSDVAKLPTSKSVHLMGLSDLMNVMRLMGVPEKVTVLLGVQPDNTDWGTELTPHVEAAQQDLVEAAFRQIEEWKGGEGPAGRSQAGDYPLSAVEQQSLLPYA